MAWRAQAVVSEQDANVIRRGGTPVTARVPKPITHAIAAGGLWPKRMEPFRRECFAFYVGPGPARARPLAKGQSGNPGGRPKGRSHRPSQPAKPTDTCAVYIGNPMIATHRRIDASLLIWITASNGAAGSFASKEKVRRWGRLPYIRCTDRLEGNGGDWKRGLDTHCISERRRTDDVLLCVAGRNGASRELRFLMRDHPKWSRSRWRGYPPAIRTLLWGWNREPP